MSGEGTFIGSITTSGRRIRASAEISWWPSSSVTAMTARRPLTASSRAHSRGVGLGRGTLVDRLHPDGHRDAEVGRGRRDTLDDLGGVGADLAAEGQLDGRVPVDRDLPTGVVVGAQQLLDAGTRRRGDVLTPVEHLRDGGDGDTGRRCHRRESGATRRRRHLLPPLRGASQSAGTGTTLVGVSNRRPCPTTRVGPLSSTVARPRSSAAEVPTTSWISPASTMRSMSGPV